MNDLSDILSQYSLSETTPINPIRESGDNQVYLIGTNDKKILRISKRLAISDVQFEYEALQHLKNNSVPVPNWIKTKTETLFATTHEIAVAVVFDFLPGYHAPIVEGKLPTQEQAYTAGKTLGLLANAGHTFTPTGPRTRTIFSELNRVITHQEIFRNEFNGGKEFVEQVIKGINFAKTSTAPQGLIHNDYRAGNIFFKTDTQVAGVIDFDWSCIAPSVKDLALGVLEWSYPDGSREAPDWEIFDAFLAGYNSTAVNKYAKGQELYQWIQFAALSDVSTFFCDRLTNPDLKKEINYSYMYRKFLYFSKIK